MSAEKPAGSGLQPVAHETATDNTSMASNTSTLTHDQPERTNEKKMRSTSVTNLEHAEAPLQELELEAGSDGEDESHYPGPVALSLLMLAICLAVFLVALVSAGTCEVETEPAD